MSQHNRNQSVCPICRKPAVNVVCKECKEDSEILARFTCATCDWETNGCEYSFDGYNTNGDCLATK